MIVTGARQIGKTYIVREFGKEFDSFIELNFLQQPELSGIFKNSLTVDAILMGIRLSKPGIKIVEGNTLLFLDEIQECPEAITALKFLAEDKRIRTIASGSALGMAYNRTSSFPVGDMDGLYSRRINIKHRLVYQVYEENKIVKIVSAWSHYENI